MRITLRIFIVSLLLLSHCIVESQPFYFKHFEVESGLSNNSITCSLQDKMGFIWFGTKDGLNRFDGYNFKVFRKNKNIAGSIGNNYIYSLFQDKKGTLWVGTEKGLFKYINSTESFERIEAPGETYINSITEDSLGNLWYISNFTLCRYVPSENKVHTYEIPSHFVTTSLCTDAKGNLWASAGNGTLNRYEKNSDSFYAFDLFTHSEPMAPRWIETTYATSDGKFLVGTSANLFKVVDPVNLTYEDRSIPCSPQPDLFIRTIQQTGNNQFWFGTESGTFVYNIASNQCEHLSKATSNPYSLSDNSVNTFCLDKEGGVWIGTSLGGINYLANQRMPIEKFFPLSGPNSISGNLVRGIQQDNNGNLWVGTEDAGLNKIDTKTGQITHLVPGPETNLSFFNIQGLALDSNLLWIGTFQHGIDVLDVNKNKVVKHYWADWRNGLGHNYVYTLYKTKSGKILVGTVNSFFAFNKQTEHFDDVKGLPGAIWYSSITEDADASIWTGTFGNGVFHANLQTGFSKKYLHDKKDEHSLSSDRVNTVFKDSRNRIWIGTDDGLCLWNKQQDNFTRFGTENGFPSDFILAIQEDNEHFLWISTTNGLFRFQPETNDVRIYKKSNGLLNDQFNFNASFKDNSGRLYFGSTKGMISFLPATPKHDNAGVQPIYFTQVRINNEDVQINSEHSPIKISPLFLDDITLKHNQSTISIEFATVSFTDPETIQYFYRVDGLLPNWIDLKNNRKISFNELQPGKYTLHIKSVNSFGLSNNERTLQIEVLQPWWFNNWAKSLYTLLFLLGAYMVLHFYHQRMEEKNNRKFHLMNMEKEKEMLALELENEKELLQAKIDFFTNVAHEIKTPLTLIKVPLNTIIKKVGEMPEIKNSLNIMSQNTTRLVELTNQLLDFRQVEINRFHVNMEMIDVKNLLTETCINFEALAQQNNLSFEYNVPAENCEAEADRDAMHKVLYNLVGNAVKYASSQVLISLEKQESNLLIRVKNDGYKIPEHLHEKIFEPFFRIREVEGQTGTGIGLALSRSLVNMHRGILRIEETEQPLNVFTLQIPLTQEKVIVQETV